MLVVVVVPDDFAVDLAVLDLLVVVFDEPDEAEAFVVAEPEDLALLAADELVEEAADESVEEAALSMVDVGEFESSDESVEEASDFDVVAEVAVVVSARLKKPSMPCTALLSTKSCIDHAETAEERRA